MQAIRIEGPNQLRLADVPEPVPGPHDVLVEVSHVGICHTDIEILRGTHGAYRSGWASYPIVPGHEWSGYVREVGRDVGRFAPGQLVTGETGIGCGRCKVCLSGAYNCCPDVSETGIINRDGAMRRFHVQHEAFVHGLEGVAADEGAVIEPASVGLYACKRVHVQPGDRVVVCGGGSIGQLCAQAARAHGARRVMLTSRSPHKLELARSMGADRVANASADDLLQVALDVTDGELFDVAIEAAGTRDALDDAIRLCGPRGRVAVVGYAAGEPYNHPLAKLIGVELSIIGVRGSPHVWPQTIDFVQRGKLSLGPIITHRYSLDQFEQAFAVAMQGGPDVLKVLLEL